MKIFGLEHKYFDIAFLEYNYLTKMKNRGYPIRPTFFLIFEPNYYFLLKLYTTFFYEKCSTLTATWQKFDLLYICRHNIISPWLREIPKNTRTYKIESYQMLQCRSNWKNLKYSNIARITNYRLNHRDKWNRVKLLLKMWLKKKLFGSPCIEIPRAIEVTFSY